MYCSACQAIAAKRAEEFLRAVGSEDDADKNSQNGQAVTSAGRQNLVNQCAHAASSLESMGGLAAILISKFMLKAQKTHHNNQIIRSLS
jgi:hypothetical protein